MMTQATMKAMVDAIRRTGRPEEEASRYASLIGDTPELSDDLREIVVRDDLGTELARLPVAVLGEDA